MGEPAVVNYRKINQNVTISDIDREVLNYWHDHKIQEKVINRGGEKKFTFLEGPPTANGRPHIGHAMTRTFKDVNLRYMGMTGHQIQRRTGGWDCHGLPVELEAEKHFGFKTKSEIEAFGIDKFNSYCRESVFRYIDEWKQVDDIIGFSVNHDDDYVTLRNDYMESEWHVLKMLYEEGLLYKDYTIVPYCPRCETSLSSHELAQGYKDIKDPSVYVKFREAGKENYYFLAWTTTPWTLPSNEFLVVNPEIEYSLVEYENSYYYLASSRAGELIKNGRVVGKFTGKDLAGKRYEQLMPFLKAPEGTLRIVTGDFVSTEEGTGIVHAAPAFGADDFLIGKRENVEILNPVDKNGIFTDRSLPWHGKFVRDANDDIIKYLKTNGMLFKSEKYLHSYPFCYRCDTPLLYYPLDAWFIKVSSIRDKLLMNNEKITWKPEYLKYGRFGNFLIEAKDWNLSRDRFWGTPLPVWRCNNNHVKFIGSRDELRKMGAEVPEDLHRPFIDNVTFKCPECGEDMKREPYVIDTWFDSGSATYAAMHYPFENKFDPENDLPVSFITEAIDQTRGWFYTLHVISSLIFSKNAYESVLSISFILDAEGRKMSKSKGNSVYALDFLRDVPPDSLRLFFLFGAPWKSKNLDRKVIDDLSRKILSTILNTYAFFSYNANIDNFEFRGIEGIDNIMDRWMISRLNSYVMEMKKAFENLDLQDTVKLTLDFVDELSNFYLRLSRRRFWEENNDEAKMKAYSTLYYTLLNLSRSISPIVPFFSDYIYMSLNGPKESVHLDDYPVPDQSRIDIELQDKMKAAYTLIEVIRRVRQENSIKGRQPVSEIKVSGVTMDNDIISIISGEINAKKLSFINAGQRPLKHKVSLIFSKAAPVFRSRINDVKNAVENSDPEYIYTQLEEKGTVHINGFDLTRDMIDITVIPDPSYGYGKDESSGIEVFINKNIDRNELLEGMAREIVRRIQVMRKDSNLEYTDKIVTFINDPGSFSDAINAYSDYIKNETLSERIEFSKDGEYREWDIDGEKIGIRIEKI